MIAAIKKYNKEAVFNKEVNEAVTRWAFNTYAKDLIKLLYTYSKNTSFSPELKKALSVGDTKAVNDEIHGALHEIYLIVARREIATRFRSSKGLHIPETCTDPTLAIKILEAAISEDKRYWSTYMSRSFIKQGLRDIKYNKYEAATAPYKVSIDPETGKKHTSRIESSMSNPVGNGEDGSETTTEDLLDTLALDRSAPMPIDQYLEITQRYAETINTARELAESAENKKAFLTKKAKKMSMTYDVLRDIHNQQVNEALVAIYGE
jgi:hypothetical protein